MTDQAVQSGDTLAKVNEILNTVDPGDTGEHNEDADDYTPDLENSGDLEDDQDENLENNSDDLEDDDSGDEGEQEEDDADADDADAEDDDDADGEGEGDIENISQLAEHLEAEESAIYSLEVPMGDGLEPVSISELKDSYMNRERDQKQFAENQQKFDEAVKYHQAQWEENNKLPQYNEVVLAAATNVQAIEQADANFDWDALEKSDPTQALLQRQKLADAHALALQEYKEAVGQVEQGRQKAFNDMKAYEKSKTLEAIPEWTDPTKYQKDADKMGPLLLEYGFNNDEIKNVYDHRLTKLVRDFTLLKEEAGKADLNKKKLRIVPKKLSGKNSQSRKVGKKVALNRKIDAAKKSTDNRVKASAVADLLNS